MTTTSTDAAALPIIRRGNGAALHLGREAGVSLPMCAVNTNYGTPRGRIVKGATVADVTCKTCRKIAGLS